MAHNDRAKYEIISHEIASRIDRRELEPGMKVPSENEIREQYGVSNTTARKALQDLELHGYARRVKGRGTYVQERTVSRTANRILSFTRNILQLGRTPRTEVLYAGQVSGGYRVDLHDSEYAMDGPLYKVHRLRFADDQPVLLEARYISSDLCPGIVEHDLAGSLYEIYREVYGLHLSEIRQSLTATILDQSTMGFFNLNETTPGILVESVTFCATGRPLEMERSIYRGDVYHFIVTATDS